MAHRVLSFVWLPLTLTLAGTGCGSDDDGADGTADQSGDSNTDFTDTGDGSTDTGTDTGDGSTDTGTGGDSGLPDLNEASILEWLEEGGYAGWTAESAIHPSSGPHGQVRVFFNPALETSFMEDAESHPEGAATVKELYDSEGTSIGWVVAIKAATANADPADNWYWFEYRGGQVVAADYGSPLCTSSCHEAGTDYVLTGYPLN